MPKPSDIGVIVGRFQVHELHAAHLALIRSVYDTHPITLVVIGLSHASVSMRNPLDFQSRQQMLLNAFPLLIVRYVTDEPTDEGWSQRLDNVIAGVFSAGQTICLYGGRDSFAAHYTGVYPVEILEPTSRVSGTALRKSISRAVQNSPGFRAGVIWAAANCYPHAFPTVDIATYRVKKDDSIAFEWLLVRKATEQLYRFPGGFVTPQDASYEAAARRELREETGAEAGVLTYACSTQVDDWRYRREDDKIITALFTAQYLSGTVEPGDDVSEATWLQEDQISESRLVHEHRHLWRTRPLWRLTLTRVPGDAQ